MQPADPALWEWGWTIGADVEHAFTSKWSARIEYDQSEPRQAQRRDARCESVCRSHLSRRRRSFGPDGRSASVDQDIHAFKLGLNYRFRQRRRNDVVDLGERLHLGAIPRAGPRPFEIEAGARYVHWWSRFQQDLAALNISRLTWDDVAMDGGEVFWRIDAPRSIVLKGYWGAGSATPA